MKDIVKQVTDDRTMIKIVLSRPSDRTVLKTTASFFMKKGELFIQFETLHTDGKATHVNMPAGEAPEYTERIFREGYRQSDIITTGGNCTVMISSSGGIHIKNNIKTAAPVTVGPHDSDKKYILDEQTAYPFLNLLGITDAKGRVYDKKRSKYRQINRFLELVDDIYDKLPQNKIVVCDLCCGKGYLTFAVFWFLTEKKGRETEMYGVDIKGDVIAECAAAAEKLGYGKLHFINGDAYHFTPPEHPALVISLHACDIATDIVLAGAVKQTADVILSTPCCHHELNGQIDCMPLSFITGHSILRQKLCDAATDALRILRLQIAGYETTAIELIDPDETPKNVLLRAVRKNVPDDSRRGALIDEYKAACRLLGADPALDKLLGKI